MQEERLQHYKNKLLNERKKVHELLDLMVKNETIDSKSEIASELSFYDNHPSDIATELSDIERGMAFRDNEKSILNKIDKALDNIKSGEYGVCKDCGAVINENRLEFIPYAEYCTRCQNIRNSNKPREIRDRPVEEEVMGYPFGKTYDETKYSSEFDREDCYQSVARFDKIHNVVEAYDHDDDQDYVEPIEKISNQQYKNQLPD